MGKLEGKTALVTGGSSGIGLATAKRFVKEGAYVFITGRREPELARAVKEIGRNVTAVQGDVSDLGDLDRLFARVKREKGKLVVLFANAGVAKYAPLGTITEEFYDSIFDINVKGLLFTVQKALPLLPDGASIILNASIVASRGLPTNSVYAATKAAVRSFARTWATDLKDRRIRVNAISPGPRSRIYTLGTLIDARCDLPKSCQIICESQPLRVLLLPTQERRPIQRRSALQARLTIQPAYQRYSVPLSHAKTHE